MGVAAVALPVLAALWGAFAFRKVDQGTAIRWSILFAGLVVLVPSAISVLGGTAGEPTRAAGWLGAAVAVLLVSALAAVGGAVVIFFLFAALCVATVGWNPLRSAFHGGRFAMTQARQAAVSLPRPAVTLPSPLQAPPQARRFPASRCRRRRRTTGSRTRSSSSRTTATGARTDAPADRPRRRRGWTPSRRPPRPAAPAGEGRGREDGRRRRRSRRRAG